MEDILRKIKSTRLCLMAHPDNEEHSEFADRISDLEKIEDELSKIKTDWIKVEDKLPNLSTFVIAYKKNGKVLGLYYSADKEFYYSQVDQTNQVTHWMPLPEPPKK